jgi:SAM-dependent methyltransferase
MSTLGLREHLTHRGNLRSSRYGWLRLTPMYSVHLVEQLLAEDLHGGGRVLDPFCGTGTTALVCAERGVPCETTDINPFLLWLTRAKAHAYGALEIAAARQAALVVADAARDSRQGRDWVPPLSNIEKWWEPPVLDALSRAWRQASRSAAGIPAASHWLLAIAFLRTAIRTAHVSFGHQSMSFSQKGKDASQLSLVGGNRSAGVVVTEWEDAISSITDAAGSSIGAEPKAVYCDARTLTDALERRSYTTVITSPPYCNRMSYIRELRPYMYWMGYLTDARAAGDLDWRAIGGTWGAATSNVARWEPDSPLRIPYAGFEAIVAAVSSSSGRHADLLARYIAKYFHDTVLHAQELFEVVKSGGTIHYIVGNSKFYDTMVPTEELYAAIFEDVGFENVAIKTLRKRTSKKELFEYLVSAKRP